MSKGGGSSAPTEQRVISTDLPEYVEPYFKRILRRGEAESLQPRQQFGAERLAYFSPDELTAQAMTRGYSQAGSPQELQQATQTVQGMPTGYSSGYTAPSFTPSRPPFRPPFRRGLGGFRPDDPNPINMRPFPRRRFQSMFPPRENQDYSRYLDFYNKPRPTIRQPSANVTSNERALEDIRNKMGNVGAGPGLISLDDLLPKIQPTPQMPQPSIPAQGEAQVTNQAFLDRAVPIPNQQPQMPPQGGGQVFQGGGGGPMGGQAFRGGEPLRGILPGAPRPSPMPMPRPSPMPMPMPMPMPRRSPMPRPSPMPMPRPRPRPQPRSPYVPSYNKLPFERGISRFMSPYQQNVTDIAKRQAESQSAAQGEQIAEQAARAGGLGGYREAILQAERQKNLGQRLDDIQARGSQQAFDRAVGQVGAERAADLAGSQFDLSRLGQLEGARQAQERLRQSGFDLGNRAALSRASQLSNLAQQRQADNLARINALRQQGAQQRALRQAGLDMAYQDFLRQQDDTRGQIGFYSSLLRGVPVQANQTVSTMQQQPGLFQSLIGTGLGALGLYKGMQ